MSAMRSTRNWRNAMKRNDASTVRCPTGRGEAGRWLPLILAVGLGCTRPTVEVTPGDEADLRTKAAMEGVIVHVPAGQYNLTDYLVLGTRTDLVGETVLVDSVDADGNPGPDGVPDSIDLNGNYDPNGNYFNESTATIIDGSALVPTLQPFVGLQPPFEYCDDPPNTDYGLLRGVVGLTQPVITCEGKNRLARLAVHSTRPLVSGNPWALIGNAQSAAVDLEIAGCAIGRVIGPAIEPSATHTSGLINAVSLWHAGCAANGNQSRLTVTGSVFQRNFHHGITVSNSVTVGTSSRVHITGCRFTGNNDGLAASAGNPGDHNEIDVLSMGNIYEGNANGIVLVSGESKKAVFGVNRGGHFNRLRFTSKDDAIWANDLLGRLRPFTLGGIVVWGALRGDARDAGGDAHTDNEVLMRLVRTRFFKEGSGRQNLFLAPPLSVAVRRNVTILGAVDIASPRVPMERNVVTYLIRQAQSSDGFHAVIRDDDDVPDDPTDGNRAKQVGSNVASEEANPVLFPPIGGVGP